MRVTLLRFSRNLLAEQFINKLSFLALIQAGRLHHCHMQWLIPQVAKEKAQLPLKVWKILFITNKHE